MRTQYSCTRPLSEAVALVGTAVYLSTVRPFKLIDVETNTICTGWGCDARHAEHARRVLIDPVQSVTVPRFAGSAHRRQPSQLGVVLIHTVSRPLSKFKWCDLTPHHPLERSAARGTYPIGPRATICDEGAVPQRVIVNLTQTILVSEYCEASSTLQHRETEGTPSCTVHLARRSLRHH